MDKRAFFFYKFVYLERRKKHRITRRLFKIFNFEEVLCIEVDDFKNSSSDIAKNIRTIEWLMVL